MSQDVAIQLLRKRTKRLKYCDFIIWGVAVFYFFAAWITYTQGAEIAELTGHSAFYGNAFWNGIEFEDDYTASRAIADGRYATSMLYAGGGAIMIFIGFTARFQNKFHTRILAALTENEKQ